VNTTNVKGEIKDGSRSFILLFNFLFLKIDYTVLRSSIPRVFLALIFYKWAG